MADDAKTNDDDDNDDYDYDDDGLCCCWMDSGFLYFFIFNTT